MVEPRNINKKGHTNINIGAATAAALDARRRDGETRTSRLDTDLADYYSLLADGMRTARLALSPAEASLILDVQNGTIASPIASWAGGALAHQVSDGIALDGLAEKWGIDGSALVAKLDKIGDVPCIALVDWAAGVWAKGDFDIAAETAIFKGA